MPVRSVGLVFAASDGWHALTRVALAAVPAATAMALISLLRAAATPPGRARAPKGAALSTALDGGFCRTCAHARPPRAHHCGACQHCVLRRDHHCPWLGTCVGEANTKFFFVGVVWSFVACSAALAFWLPLALGTWQPLRRVVAEAASAASAASDGRLLAPARPREPLADPTAVANAAFLLSAQPVSAQAALTLLAALSLALGGLVVMQAHLLVTNRTMHELGGPAVHSRGSWRANVEEVLGPNALTWLLPIAAPAAAAAANITAASYTDDAHSTET